MTNTNHPGMLRYPVSKIRQAINAFLRSLPEEAATVPTVRYRDEEGGGIIFSCGDILVTFHLSAIPSIDGKASEEYLVEGLSDLLYNKMI